MRFPIAPVLLFSSLAVAQPPYATPIEGYWRNPSGTAIIAIAPCRTMLCGRVAWASARGRREVSKNAPNVVGSTVLTGVRRNRGQWTGSLYIPDDDIHVQARLQPIGSSRMKLTGCAIMGIFCRTQVWTRVDGLPSAG